MDGTEIGRDILSRVDMTAVIARDADRLEQAQAVLSRAQNDYAYHTGRQHHPTPEMQEEARRQHLPKLSPAEDEAIATAESVTRNALGIRRQLSGLGSVVMTPEEAAQAAAQAGFVKEDAERLRWVELAARMRGAILRADRVEQILWLRYGDVRIEATGKEARSPERDEAARLLQQIRESLRDRSFDRIRELADANHATAIQLKSVAIERRGVAQFQSLPLGRKVARWPDRAAG